MPKILHLIPSLEGGGAERQLVMLALEQARRGWDVHIALRRGGVYQELLRNSNVVIHQLGNYRRLNPRLFFRINSILRKLKPDLVQTWLPQMDVVGGIVALLNAAPWVATERSSRLDIENLRLRAWLRRWVCSYSTAMVANSVAGVSYWRSVLPADVFIEQIPNAVDLASVRNAVPEVQVNLHGNKKLILVVGRLVSSKAVETILKAVAILPDPVEYKVLVIGEGPMRQQLEALVKNLGVGDRVDMLPFQSRWWGFLKSASALVSMSRCEGQPNVVLEAMAAGCPLILSDIPEHREILSDDSAIFVPVDNSVALAESIRSLLLDPIAAQKRSEYARDYVDRLSVELTTDAYESVYAKVGCRGDA